MKESLNASAAQLLMEFRSLAAQLGTHANRTAEAFVQQILKYDDTDQFSSRVRGMYAGLDKEHKIIIKVCGSLFLFFVIVLGLLRPLLSDIFFMKEREEEEEEEEEGIVPVKSLFNDGDFSRMVNPHQAPSTPRKPSKSQVEDEAGELVALRRIHKKALNLHSLLGMTFRHLEHCEGDLHEVMDQLTLAEASVASSCVSLLDEIETEMGGITLPRSPVQLPKPGSNPIANVRN